MMERRHAIEKMRDVTGAGIDAGDGFFVGCA